MDGMIGNSPLRSVPQRPAIPDLPWRAWFSFFLLLFAYYLLRPLREEMAIVAGVENIQLTFALTFTGSLLLVPLLGWVSSLFSRRYFVPILIVFFVLQLAVLWTEFHSWVVDPRFARGYVVWLSVFNLFSVSLFWSCMVDLFSEEQGKRFYGFVASGGSVGALLGPGMAALLIRNFGSRYLVLGALVALVLMIVVLYPLLSARESQSKPLGGGMWDGVLLVCRSRYLHLVIIFSLLNSIPGTFLYITQAKAVSLAMHSGDARTELFAWIDFGVNAVSLVLQAFFVPRLLVRTPIAIGLIALPLMTCFGAAIVAGISTVSVVIVAQSLRRALLYGLANPVREVLFSSLSPEEKFKAKNFMETAIFRASDSIGSGLYAVLGVVGLGGAAALLSAIPVSLGAVAIVGPLLRLRDRQPQRES